MIEQFLPGIRDAETYVAALSVLDPNGTLTAEQVEKLLEVYAGCMPELDRYTLKCFLAADLLPERDREDAAVFGVLDLNGADLDGLFLAKEIAGKTASMTSDALRGALELVQGGELSEAVQVLLARIALNVAVLSREFLTMRGAIASLSQFLIGCGEDILGRYAEPIVGVWLRCRK